MELYGDLLLFTPKAMFYLLILKGGCILIHKLNRWGFQRDPVPHSTVRKEVVASQ